MQLLTQKEQQSVYKSAGISLGAATLGLAVLVLIQTLMPEQDLTAPIAVIVTAISGFVVNFVKTVLKV